MDKQYNHYHSLNYVPEPAATAPHMFVSMIYDIILCPHLPSLWFV